MPSAGRPRTPRTRLLEVVGLEGEIGVELDDHLGWLVAELGRAPPSNARTTGPPRANPTRPRARRRESSRRSRASSRTSSACRRSSRCRRSPRPAAAASGARARRASRRRLSASFQDGRDDRVGERAVVMPTAAPAATTAPRGPRARGRYEASQTSSIRIDEQQRGASRRSRAAWRAHQPLDRAAVEELGVARVRPEQVVGDRAVRLRLQPAADGAAGRTRACACR